jgi:hypothetical protein
MDLYILRGTEGQEKVVGETRYKLSSLMNKDLVKEILANTDNTKEVVTEENYSFTTDFVFNKRIGKSLSL